GRRLLFANLIFRARRTAESWPWRREARRRSGPPRDLQRLALPALTRQTAVKVRRPRLRAATLLGRGVRSRQQRVVPPWCRLSRRPRRLASLDSKKSAPCRTEGAAPP